MRMRWAAVVAGVGLFWLLGNPARAESIEDGGSPPCDCEAAETQSGPWSGSLALGLSAAVGADKIFTASADWSSVYDARPHRFEAVLSGFYSLENRENNVNRQYGRAEYRNYFSPRWYAFGALSAERNLQQDLQFRVTPVGGPGFQLLDRDRPEAKILKRDSASLQLGIGYQYQRLSSGGQRAVDQDAVLELSGDYAMTLVREITWSSRVAYTLPPTQPRNWHVLGDTTLNLPVIGNLGVQVRLTFDYLNGPELDSGAGEKLSFLGSLGLSYSY
ncbi:MAG: DUF481 domain-containing protein [Myxococcota bacterium]